MPEKWKTCSISDLNFTIRAQLYFPHFGQPNHKERPQSRVQEKSDVHFGCSASSFQQTLVNEEIFYNETVFGIVWILDPKEGQIGHEMRPGKKFHTERGCSFQKLQ
jgi:hypothetical protein